MAFQSYLQSLLTVVPGSEPMDYHDTKCPYSVRSRKDGHKMNNVLMQGILLLMNLVCTVKLDDTVVLDVTAPQEE
jgi:hypothetical protein